MRRVIIETLTETIVGVIDENADLDGVFTITCEDTNEKLEVNGWMVSTQDYTD